MNWHVVGRRVVCVDDVFGEEWADQTCPIDGYVYTIRKVLPFLFANGEEHIALLLSEIVNPDVLWTDDDEVPFAYGEHPFWVGRFRPLINLESDLAIFEAILRGVESREVVEV